MSDSDQLLYPGENVIREGIEDLQREGFGRQGQDDKRENTPTHSTKHAKNAQKSVEQSLGTESDTPELSL